MRQDFFLFILLCRAHRIPKRNKASQTSAIVLSEFIHSKSKYLMLDNLKSKFV